MEITQEIGSFRNGAQTLLLQVIDSKLLQGIDNELLQGIDNELPQGLDNELHTCKNVWFYWSNIPGHAARKTLGGGAVNSLQKFDRSWI